LPDAHLYLDAIDYERYLTTDECRRCGADSCRALVDKLRIGNHVVHTSLDALAAEKARRLKNALGAENALPKVPAMPNPRPITTELAEINNPAPGDPVLVTGNSAFTQDVLLAVLSTTISPFFVLFTDTRGDTLDMALVFSSFTTERLINSIESERVAERASGSTLILPGLATELREGVEMATGFPVDVGPVCAAELPLFFGDSWITDA
jgi:CO dehydrogenase/acetyl-CoA synthase gamma subunit (corrinoid Fe-S protein)